MKTASGVTRFNVSKKKFSTIIIPLPPLRVQARIVEILDKFTQLEAELEDKLAKELEARNKQYDFYRNRLLDFQPYIMGKSILTMVTKPKKRSHLFRQEQLNN